MHGCNFWKALSKDSDHEADFASAMKLQDLAPKERLPQSPYAESFSSFEASVNEGDGDVFLVDVGGGNGQYLERLIQEHPDLPDRKIFQDLPTVIARVDPAQTSAEPMAHYFFTPQPIFAAKYYHLRGILHDWPDRESIEILRQLRLNFKPGYSRLLIETYFLPENNCPIVAAMQDINMWTCCGIERTESQWVEVLEAAGFHLRRIVKAEAGLHCMIEAEL
jgi:demethylsterigmatocystin 6-O-methyltransferase